MKKIFNGTKAMVTMAAATYVGISSFGASCACTNERLINKPTKEFTRKYSSTLIFDIDNNMSNTKSNYKTKTTSKNLYDEAVEIFGNFRNLTKEEEEAYIKGLKKMSSPTGRKLKI